MRDSGMAKIFLNVVNKTTQKMIIVKIISKSFDPEILQFTTASFCVIRFIVGKICKLIIDKEKIV